MNGRFTAQPCRTGKNKKSSWQPQVNRLHY
jgi:hypothetical protein